MKQETIKKEKKEERTEETKETTEKQVKEDIASDVLGEMKELLQRTQANFENYRKQQEKRIEEIREMAAKDVILQLLPVLDNFEMALKSADTNPNPKDFLKGVELIYAQLNGLLENIGIKIIATENEAFDPYFHEALIKSESELPENTIIEEIQKGYMLHSKVIRHARVRISAGKAKAEQQRKKHENEKQSPDEKELSTGNKRDGNRKENNQDN